MICLQPRYQFIQEIRFILQLLDYVSVKLKEDENSRLIRDITRSPNLLLSNEDDIVSNLSVDHKNNSVTIQGIKVYGPAIPRSLISKLDFKKSVDCIFIGQSNNTRLKDLGNYLQYCRFVDRKIVNKIWDWDYWKSMAGSRYVLIPAGQCQWTYRFYEAIMVEAVPLILPFQFAIGMMDYDKQFKYVTNLNQIDEKTRSEYAKYNKELLYNDNQISMDILKRVLRSL